MATAYSLDLRKKVLAEYDLKKRKKGEIAEIFQITPKTLYNWVRQRKLTGKIAAITGYQKGHGSKIVDMEKFKEFIANNPNSSLQELSEKWGGVSRTTIGRALHKINFTFKKNNSDIKKEMK